MQPFGERRLDRGRVNERLVGTVERFPRTDVARRRRPLGAAVDARPARVPGRLVPQVQQPSDDLELLRRLVDRALSTGGRRVDARPELVVASDDLAIRLGGGGRNLGDPPEGDEQQQPYDQHRPQPDRQGRRWRQALHRRCEVHQQPADGDQARQARGREPERCHVGVAVPDREEPAERGDHDDAGDRLAHRDPHLGWHEAGGRLVEHAGHDQDCQGDGGDRPDPEEPLLDVLAIESVVVCVVARRRLIDWRGFDGVSRVGHVSAPANCIGIVSQARLPNVSTRRDGAETTARHDADEGSRRMNAREKSP